MPDDDELVPIDYLVVEFPYRQADLDGALAIELAAMVDAELVRVLDLLVLHKDVDGSIEVVEYEDLRGLGDLQRFDGTLAEVFADADIRRLSAAVEPGSTALVLLWENTWAAPLGVAARHSGGQLVAGVRVSAADDGCPRRTGRRPNAEPRSREATRW